MSLRTFVLYGTIGVFSFLFSLDPIWGATGDVITQPDTSLASATGEENTPKTEIISFPLPFQDLPLSKVKEQLKTYSIRINNDRTHWTFTFLPDTYTLSEQRYVLFQGIEIPLSEGGIVTTYPVITKYVLHIPRKILEDYVAEHMGKEIHAEKKDVLIKKVRDKIVFEGTAENGQEVDQKGLIRGMVKAAQDDIHAVRVPVIFRPAVVTKEGLDDLNVRELIGVGVTDFSGSPSNRVHNIGVGIKKFDGVIIKRGETFSFNKQLGPVDDAHGFLPELVIKGPDTIPEFGGGLCQVSTTMFRAAIFSGLPIKERRNHSYAVQYYVWPLGWGFDATVYIGAVDLKFVNDTPGDILVQSYTEKSRAYYKFYGVSDQRKIIINGPYVTGRNDPPPPQEVPTSDLPLGEKKLKEKAHAGLSAYFTRDVIYPTGEEKKEKFVSVYEARPLVYLVGAPTAAGSPDQYYSGEVGTQ